MEAREKSTRNFEEKRFLCIFATDYALNSFTTMYFIKYSVIQVLYDAQRCKIMMHDAKTHY